MSEKREAYEYATVSPAQRNASLDRAKQAMGVPDLRSIEGRLSHAQERIAELEKVMASVENLAARLKAMEDAASPKPLPFCLDPLLSNQERKIYTDEIKNLTERYSKSQLRVNILTREKAEMSAVQGLPTEAQFNRDYVHALQKEVDALKADRDIQAQEIMGLLQEKGELAATIADMREKLDVSESVKQSYAALLNRQPSEADAKLGALVRRGKVFPVDGVWYVRLDRGLHSTDRMCASMEEAVKKAGE